MRLPAGVGFFRDEHSRAGYLRKYDDLRALGPDPDDARDVPTEFGTVRVYRFGPVQDVPLVLLHGNGMTALQWSPMLPSLAAEQTVYTLDMLGQPGRSQQTLPIRSGHDHAAWINELLDALGLVAVHLGGASMGGWVSLQVAAHHPRRVRTLTLIDPGNTLARVAMRPVLAAPAVAYIGLSRPLKERIMRWMLGTPHNPNPFTPPLVDLGLDSARAFRMPPIYPSYPPDAMLRSIHIPTLVLLAGRTVLHNTEHAARRARALLPHCRTRIWPDAGHGLPLEYPDEVSRQVLDFIAAPGDRS